MTQALAETGWGLLGTPRCADGMKADLRDPVAIGNPNGRLEDQIAILPTPAVNDMGAAYTPETWDEWTARMKAAHNNGNGHGASLNIEAQRIAESKDDADDWWTKEDARRAREQDGIDSLPIYPREGVSGGWAGHRPVSNHSGQERGWNALLPTTTTRDAAGSGGNPHTTGTHGTTLTDATVRQPSRWGKYAAAIARWEAVTRPAPEPTNITDGCLRERAKRLAGLHKKPVGMRGSLKVRRQLAARFSEWMMGVPLGWITDVPGITRNEALKAAGNGVVPQQAAEALRFLLDMPTGRDIAGAHQPVDLLELLGAS